MKSEPIYIKTNLMSGKTVYIADWVVNKNASDSVKSDLALGILEIERETEKAIYFKGTYGGFWAPKSQVKKELA